MMKKDGAIVLIAVLVVGGITYGLAAIRPPFQPRKSEPFGSTSVGKSDVRHVVMRVNDEAVTQEEFQAAFDALPEDLKRQFASAPGRQAFAEQLIRMKLLEQEGRKLGVERDPRVAGQLAAERTSIVATATAEKIVGAPTKEAVQSFYNANQGRFQTFDVSHILIAYQGGSVPPRTGGRPPSQLAAMAKARQVYELLKKGAAFSSVAVQVSDDVATAENGGQLGTFNRGMLPPEIEGRVFELKKGEVGEPVASRFGVHVFKVTNTGTAPLAQASPSIARHLKQQNTFDRVELLRKNAKVDFDAKFFPEAKNWPGGPGKRPS